MNWNKVGRIFDPENNNSGWINHYAALPVAHLVNDDCLRIYFSTRDSKGRSIPTYMDVSPGDPSDILYVHDKPILDLGKIGTFDDNGIMPSSIVEIDGMLYMYYIGWNPQKTVSYRLSIGLAISEDGGKTFVKKSEGPILDRDMYEPYFNTAPYVLKVGDEYMMWYVSCTNWEIIKEWPEPFYNIKCAKSKDGVHWSRIDATCIGYDEFTEAIGKPCVFIEDGIYKMVYSYRNATDYRIDKNKSYRLGYAESHNGIDWIRKDSVLGIKFSESGWDSMMNEYSTTYVYGNKRYLIYNGNGFGASGFGYAELILE